jgi:hypothetical protein
MWYILWHAKVILIASLDINKFRFLDTNTSNFLYQHLPLVAMSALIFDIK